MRGTQREMRCRACDQDILVDAAGRFLRHNMPGWTVGSRARADAGEIVRPETCLGSGHEAVNRG